MARVKFFFKSTKKGERRYVSKLGYRIVPVIRERKRFYTWQNWILFAWSKNLGTFKTLDDAKLEAQKHYETL